MAAKKTDNSELMKFVKQAEALQREVDVINADAKEKSEPQREQIKDIKAEAADAGYARDLFNRKLRERRHSRKAKALREGDGLSTDKKERYDEMTHEIDQVEMRLEGGTGSKPDAKAKTSPPPVGAAASPA